MKEIKKFLTLANISVECSEHKDCEKCKYFSNSCMVRTFFLGEIPAYSGIRDLIRCSEKGAVPDDLWEGFEEGYFTKGGNEI